MSSSEVRPLALIDLTRDIPPSPGKEFVEKNEFDQVADAPPPTPTAEEAYKAGLGEGEQIGRAAVSKEIQPVIARLEELIRAVAHIREARLDEVERDLTAVAIDIAKQILHSELRLEGDTVVRMARACLQEAKEEGARTLRANPADVELLQTHSAELELDLAEHALRIEADPQIPAGGVVLETECACYDGRPERILRALAMVSSPSEEERA
jgi:flagellar assembly protein FliH